HRGGYIVQFEVLPSLFGTRQESGMSVREGARLAYEEIGDAQTRPRGRGRSGPRGRGAQPQTIARKREAGHAWLGRVRPFVVAEVVEDIVDDREAEHDRVGLEAVFQDLGEEQLLARAVAGDARVDRLPAIGRSAAVQPGL